MFFLLEFLDAMPAMLAMYLAFLLLKKNLFNYAFCLIILIVLFVLLKFRLLPWEDWTPMNRLLWSIYNGGKVYVFILIFIYFNKKQYGNNCDYHRKN